MDSIIPAPNNVPLPAPVGLIKFFNLVANIIHIIPISFLFGVILYLVYLRFTSDQNDQSLKPVYEKLMGSVPVLLTISLISIIAPMILTQLLYGQTFFSASILMGNYWWAAILVVILLFWSAWSGLGHYQKSGVLPVFQLLVGAVSIILLSYLYTTWIVLMHNPDGLTAAFKDGHTSVLSVNDGQHLPRWLFFTTQAVAMGGLFIASVGVFSRKLDQKARQFMISNGLWVFSIFAGLSMILSVWWFNSLKIDFSQSIANSSALYLLYVTFAIMAVGLAWLGKVTDESGIFITGLISQFFTLIVVMWYRHLIFESYLEPIWIRTQELPVAADWGSFTLFVFLFMIAIWYLIYLVRAYYQSTKVTTVS